MSEFSRPQRVDRIPAKGLHLSITAEAAEREQLARELDLLGLDSLAAELHLTPVGRTGVVRVNGRLTASLTQRCGVTLGPVPGTIDEAFELSFAPPESGDDEGLELEITYDSEDPPDPIIDGAIDLGHVVVEHLALALDPFPRAEGAVFTPVDEAAPEPDDKPNPFAVLARFRQKGEGA
jgi:uncharacterized metal-binding protein YceD (DUF177 family)